MFHVSFKRNLGFMLLQSQVMIVEFGFFRCGGAGGCTCWSPCYGGVVDCSYDPRNHFVGDEKQEFNKG